MRKRSPAQMAPSSPPAPLRISTMTSFASLGSRSTSESFSSSSSSASRTSSSGTRSRSSESPRAAPRSSLVAVQSCASLCAPSSSFRRRPASAAAWRSEKTAGSDIRSCASAYERSISATRSSMAAMTPERVVGARSGSADPLRHYLDLALLGGDPPLEAKHLLERADRDFDLVERRLTRRQALKPHARCEEAPEGGIRCVLPREADDLVGDPGDERQEQDPRRDQPVPGRLPDEGEHEDRHHHDVEEEGGAAPHVQE